MIKPAFPRGSKRLRLRGILMVLVYHIFIRPYISEYKPPAILSLKAILVQPKNGQIVLGPVHTNKICHTGDMKLSKKNSSG
jgi:hypothetical protein